MVPIVDMYWQEYLAMLVMHAFSAALSREWFDVVWFVFSNFPISIRSSTVWRRIPRRSWSPSIFPMPFSVPGCLHNQPKLPPFHEWCSARIGSAKLEERNCYRNYIHLQKLHTPTTETTYTYRNYIQQLQKLHTITTETTYTHSITTETVLQKIHAILQKLHAISTETTYKSLYRQNFCRFLILQKLQPFLQKLFSTEIMRFTLTENYRNSFCRK